MNDGELSNKSKMNAVKTFIDLPQVQLNQSKKISTKDCVMNMSKRSKVPHTLLRSNTINIDKMEEEAIV
jgi:hypothetical protein